MKRLVDILLSSLALVVLSPLLLPVMLILKLTGEHYVFYAQDRVGKGGQIFPLLKFATMLKDSPNMGTTDITVRNDPRVLPFGRFLRKTKINELPQILNVLKGDMSIIGPRPLTEKMFNYYSEEHRKIIGELRPGLSGVGSILFRDEESLISAQDMPHHDFYAAHVSPYKGALEAWYHQHRSLWLDFKLIALTLLAIVRPNMDLHRHLKGLPERPEALTGKKPVS